MARGKKKKKIGFTPEQFLRSLGIWRGRPDSIFTPAFEREVNRTGGKLSNVAIHGLLSPQAGDVYYRTEKIAKYSLSAEYDRFQCTLRSFPHVDGYPSAPRRIADLGGGTGIVSMWLASCFPRCKVTVYDHSPRQLDLGRKWARQRGLGNIEYVQASYQQLATEPTSGDNDLVLFFHAVELYIPAPKTGSLSPMVEVNWSDNPEPPVDVQAAMTALARLVRPDGVGVIKCGWSGWGLVNLCEAIRRAGLGVDWRFSQCIPLMMRGKAVMGDNHLFVRRDLPCLGKNSREDALAHVDSLNFTEGPWVFESDPAEPTGEDFRDGDELLVAEGISPSDGVETVRLIQNEGFLLLEITSERGGRQSVVASLHGIYRLLFCATARAVNWNPDGQREEVHERLERFLSYCNKHETKSD